jgi:hypothetical protein
MTQPINRPPFARRHYPRAALATLIVALLPGAALAEAARVTFSHGPVAATAADGARRALARGAEIDAGDTISTGKGRAQLRFTDGSFVSLKPNTDFRVDEYAFKGGNDTTERGFFSLLRGGLRTITGLVGRVRKGRYRMRTSVATLGIRGTDYNLDLLTDDSGQPVLKWNVADDGKSSIVLLLADGEERTFSWGGAGSATRQEFALLVKALQQLADEGRLESVSKEELVEIFASGDDVGDDGRAEALADLVISAVEVEVEVEAETPVPPPACSTAMPSCTIAAAFGAFRGGEAAGVYVDGGEGNLSTSFASDGTLQSYSHDDGLYIASDGGEGFVTFFDSSSNAQVNTALAVVDGSKHFSVDAANPEDPATIATWGRWIAPVGGGASTGPDDEAHSLTFRDGEDDAFAYVISIPPPDTYAMGTGTYSLAGFTPPAVLGGGAAALGAAGAVTGSLTANFGAGYVQLNMTVPFANGSYSVTDSGGLGLYARSGYAGNGTPFFKGNLNVTGSGVACGWSCDGYAAGNVFGPRADGAALGYEITDSNLSNSSITGAAVFQQENCVGCGVTPAVE